MTFSCSRALASAIALVLERERAREKERARERERGAYDQRAGPGTVQRDTEFSDEKNPDVRREL